MKCAVFIVQCNVCSVDCAVYIRVQCGVCGVYMFSVYINVECSVYRESCFGQPPVVSAGAAKGSFSGCWRHWLYLALYKVLQARRVLYTVRYTVLQATRLPYFSVSAALRWTSGCTGCF